ncbi:MULTISPECIES: GNAT family N-acetyltransferase [Thermoanaerobacterium]|jgi:GNAT superfamily N-acetyltransferase|uniref:GNAT superfamily N-acetyltransferase n=1 Tax=Thermoanaerobacterium butyriciformans TaxID=1702242 RepID=A0ABS4NHV5_9THEO|nr:GNAT family N-acetyltransferase [Thermoanaerobacterium butyriciformans]MBP2073250.1 GNAT superfamily N-acetyltransferase [Thermoanaerobacterium butyriciformans]WHE07638.1 GNAT family N-acetyltransferase [Thermoanaerobacterium thermosaccharolyticum]
MYIKPILIDDRQRTNDFIKSRWFSTEMVVGGEIVNMTKLQGFVVYENEEIIGLATYRINGCECEIMSLDSLKENQGIGTALLNKIIEEAINKKCTKIKLITTNDNINAIRFYQKRGFDMVRIHHNAVDAARKLKPSIPLLGNYGIPIKHEIEFEMNLDR